MRGKELSSIVKLPPHRITPAYAGKRKFRKRLSFKIRDHPRVCGEKLKSRKFSVLILGSPPRMRGKVPLPALDQGDGGITPAYAGKSGGLGQLEADDQGITPAYAGKRLHRGRPSAVP